MLQVLVLCAFCVPFLGLLGWLIAPTIRRARALGTWTQTLAAAYADGAAFLTTKKLEPPIVIQVHQRAVHVDLHVIDDPKDGLLVELRFDVHQQLAWLALTLLPDLLNPGAPNHRLKLEAIGGAWAATLLDVLMIFDEPIARRLQHALLAVASHNIGLRHLSLSNATCHAKLHIYGDDAHLNTYMHNMPALITPLVEAIVTLEGECPGQPWDFWSKVFYGAWHNESAQRTALFLLMTQCPNRPETIALWHHALQHAKPGVVLGIFHHTKHVEQWLPADLILPPQRWLALLGTAVRQPQPLMALVEALTSRCWAQVPFERILNVTRADADALSVLFAHYWAIESHQDALFERLEQWVQWVRPGDAVQMLLTVYRDRMALALPPTQVVLRAQFLTAPLRQVLVHHLALLLATRSQLLSVMGWVEVVVALLPFASSVDARNLSLLLLNFAPPQSFGLLQHAVRTPAWSQCPARAAIEGILPKLHARASAQTVQGALSVSDDDKVGGLTVSTTHGQLTALTPHSEGQ